jgi:ABC-type branched-subunit amino acid transport system permease subunit
MRRFPVKFIWPSKFEAKHDPFPNVFPCSKWKENIYCSNHFRFILLLPLFFKFRFSIKIVRLVWMRKNYRKHMFCSASLFLFSSFVEFRSKWQGITVFELIIIFSSGNFSFSPLRYLLVSFLLFLSFVVLRGLVHANTGRLLRSRSSNAMRLRLRRLLP